MLNFVSACFILVDKEWIETCLKRFPYGLLLPIAVNLARSIPSVMSIFTTKKEPCLSAAWVATAFRKI